MTKRLHVGRGAQMGLEAALFASMGMTGPATVLEGTHGFLNAYSDGPKPDEITKGLGREWRMLGIADAPLPLPRELPRRRPGHGPVSHAAQARPGKGPEHRRQD